MQISRSVFLLEIATVDRKYLAGEILANHAGKGYWRMVKNQQSLHMPYSYVFRVSVNIGEENLANGSRFAKLADFSLIITFPCIATVQHFK